jgi:hypothetical protein
MKIDIVTMPDTTVAITLTRSGVQTPVTLTKERHGIPGYKFAVGSTAEIMRRQVRQQRRQRTGHSGVSEALCRNDRSPVLITLTVEASMNPNQPDQSPAPDTSPTPTSTNESAGTPVDAGTVADPVTESAK